MDVLKLIALDKNDLRWCSPTPGRRGQVADVLWRPQEHRRTWPRPHFDWLAPPFLFPPRSRSCACRRALRF